MDGNGAKTFAYLRVSTDKQQTEKNKAEIERLVRDKGLNSPIIWFEETISGRKSWRERKLAYILEQMQAGDVLVTPEISRLGRRAYDALEFVNKLKQKGCSLCSAKELGITLDGSPSSDFMINLLSSVAEFETAMTRERIKTALAVKKAAGVKLGRPKGRRNQSHKHAEKDRAILATLKEHISLRETARRHDVSTNYIYSLLSREGKTLKGIYAN